MGFVIPPKRQRKKYNKVLSLTAKYTPPGTRQSIEL
jgi:hypothetical protein